jgi:hypothetical protein
VAKWQFPEGMDVHGMEINQLWNLFLRPAMASHGQRAAHFGLSQSVHQ